ncbi:2-succinyl-5-enolpyruvyl-6-hydroxy-3-cyclohexene-1-carboxylic-acid synthase [bacterium]|nr:2-succinyl-5-enolpyruvyl-6-hydroxy-3-cyclohexene-1-carboxylic-acid synthase [bacterium]
MNNLDARNLNSLWSSTMVETWARSGLKRAVISPGSRSTPLAVALAQHPDIDAIPVVDERSAAFFGLGMARSTHTPVVLLCTSGSAGAHYLPAMIEAKETGVPLIAVTADRPPEMRECASGQTIDQHRLFGNYATWYHELALPELDEGRFNYLRQITRQAFTRSQQEGPVHLNLPFRDPLPPVSDGGTAEKWLAKLPADFFELAPAPDWERSKARLRQRLTTQRGVIVAGPAMPEDPAAYAAHILGLSSATGWPILADALSPLRQHASEGANVVSAYDIILRDAKVARDLTPRFVVCLESWPTSKVLRTWLEESQSEMLMISERSGSRDAVHGRTREITASPLNLEIESSSEASQGFAREWQAAENRVREKIETWMTSDAAAGFEGKSTHALSATIPADSNLVVASSMPVRDLEYFWPTTNRGIQVYASRGANGIDGTLSTALGVAHASDRPTVLLTGDLAFLHDANGLMSARELDGSLTVILINNSGGRIFEHLPIGEFDPPFERFFGTPPTVDFAQLCAAHDVSHRLVSDVSEASLQGEFEAPGLRIWEVRTDGKKDAATRKRLLRDLARA